jgi:hypothetical protein
MASVTVPEDVKTHVPLQVNVGMIDFCLTFHLNKDTKNNGIIRIERWNSQKIITINLGRGFRLPFFGNICRVIE